MHQDQIFALDIGTRKIVGLVMQKDGELYRVTGSEMREHKTRAMMDGQIHDVEAVAATILDIRENLERRLNISLESAAVAAAGRSLKTASGCCLKRRPPTSEVTREEVTALELEAVQNAQTQLVEQETPSIERSSYFCVGYSVVNYRLEEQYIGSLVGQVGSEIRAEVIATFLPRVVVDSLFSSLKRAGLTVQSLTLEPIAALSVAIPVNMRMLNLALVDIGAGTSDIALVRNGNVFAYAMVPFGGDELTEKIAAHYLLDFLTAETVKRQMNSSVQLQFQDILGNGIEVAVAELAQVLEPAARDLALAIAEHILALNGKMPDAVLCVGGGSLTLNLTALIAAALNLPSNRVGIRTPESFAQIEVDPDFLAGPQGVTPLGIAFHSLTMPVVPFINVVVNGRDVPLWNMGKLTVASGLLSSGISLANIWGRPGLGKTLEVNGIIKVFKGALGTPPQVDINGQPASLDSEINNGDRIVFERGVDGQDVHIFVTDLAEMTQGQAWVNGVQIQLKPIITVNDEVWPEDREIPDRARVEISAANQLRNVLIQADVPTDMLQETLYHYKINSKDMVCRWQPVGVKVDGKPAHLDELIDYGAHVEYKLASPYPRIGDLDTSNEMLNIRVKVNGQPIELSCREPRILMNGREIDRNSFLADAAEITIDTSHSQAILSDIFRVIEVKPMSNGRLTIRVNGEEAGFTTPISEGSDIELHWDS